LINIAVITKGDFSADLQLLTAVLKELQNKQKDVLYYQIMVLTNNVQPPKLMDAIMISIEFELFYPIHRTDKP